MNSSKGNEKTNEAVRAARMFYYQNMKTDAIARELRVSRSTVSRLLTFARSEGLVDIRINDPDEHSQQLEVLLQEKYHIRKVHVVPISNAAEEAQWLEQVARYTASYLNTIFCSGMVMGIAWGTTTSAISRHLNLKATYNTHVVQLNGAGNTQTLGVEYASEIIRRFAQNYQAQAHLFPVPTFFDYAETKQALWKERSIKRILELHQKTDLLLYSIGAVNGGVPSHVYNGDYLEDADNAELERYGLVGDIATVFFREDGSFNGIPINERASGPALELFQRKHGICVVSGLAKVRGLQAALCGRLMTELIVDEPTARKLKDL